MKRLLLRSVTGLLVLSVAAVAVVDTLNRQDEDRVPQALQVQQMQREPTATAQLVERGRYLALAGNCAGCHTVRGGTPYAGGVGIATPFGLVYSSNLTPDTTHGIGDWSAAQFWRAMHNGRSREGRLLYPAFPYPSLTKLTREDSDAIYAYLQHALLPSARPNDAHTLRFPYNTQAALALWRAVSFRPASYVQKSDRSPEWNRGGYLVEGLGHCIECHGTRNALGAIQDRMGLSGGSLRIDGWYAPSLLNEREAALSHWDERHIAELLKTGRSDAGSVMGPMADVVYESTQHLSDADLGAMATYLKALPAPTAMVASAAKNAPAAPSRRDSAVMLRGEKVYAQQCAYCHGNQGEGSIDAYPPLAGNRSVLMDPPTNLIRIVQRGGYLPATQGNPRPYGMPPFGQVLHDQDLTAVLTYVRGAWGNYAAPVSAQALFKR
ncbi:MAG: alcohol dehydrogenase [Variovorax sp.]|jgi:mono/diheme cytochrome c family protein|nr:alcohol dehydrogenase [Variovorax sp.]